MLGLFLASCRTISIPEERDPTVLVSDFSEDALKFPETISKKEADADLRFLSSVLSSAYGGNFYFSKEVMDRNLSALRNISSDENLISFHDKIDQALFAFQDNHLLAYYKGRTSRERTRAQKLGQVGANAVSPAGAVWEVRQMKVNFRKILYIAITRFPNSHDQIWNGFLDSVIKNLPTSSALILDLRGNGGGDDTKGMELAKILYGQDFEHPITKQHRLQTPEALALQINGLKLNAERLRQDGHEVPANLKEEIESLEVSYKKAKAGELPSSYVRLNKGNGKRSEKVTGYQKPIYVLMDGACGSSCEFLIAAFEWHPFVKNVGENTNGTFHFSNAGLAILPHSKFKVFVPSQYSEYFDKRFIERVGLSPDIKVEPGKDALTVAEQLIKAEFQK